LQFILEALDDVKALSGMGVAGLHIILSDINDALHFMVRDDIGSCTTEGGDDNDGIEG